MTEISFHFNAPDKLGYVCRLLREVVGSGSRVVVTGEAATLHALDKLLWTFSATDFLPHCRAGSPAEQLLASPIVLAAQLEGRAVLPHHAVLVNLKPDTPEGFARFERLIEVVSLDDDDRQQARQRWKYYSDRGYSIIRHDLKLSQTSA